MSSDEVGFSLTSDSDAKGRLRFMQFVNFVNNQTFHVFKWLIAPTREAQTKKLIAKAFEQVEGDEWFKMDLSVSDVAREKLGDLIEEEVRQSLNQWIIEKCELMEYFDLDANSIGEIVPDADGQQASSSLVVPIVTNAFQSIGYSAIAEALLIRAKHRAVSCRTSTDRARHFRRSSTTANRRQGVEPWIGE